MFEEDMSLSSHSDAVRNDRRPARSARYKDCPTIKALVLNMFLPYQTNGRLTCAVYELELSFRTLSITVDSSSR